MFRRKEWRPVWYNIIYDELYHHGIKGQSWGDKNGPPYPLDRKVSRAVSRGMSKKEIQQMKKDEMIKQKEAERKAQERKKTLAKARAAKVKKKQDAEREEKRKEREEARQAKRKEKILSDPSKLYKHRKEFTKEELSNAMRVFEFENKLSNLSKERIKQGAEFSKSLVTIGAASLTGWNMVASIYNSWNDYNKTGKKQLPQLKFENLTGGGNKDKKK